MKRLTAIFLLTALLLAGCGGQTDYVGPMETKWVVTESRQEYWPWSDQPDLCYTTQRLSSYDRYGNQVSLWEYQDGELSLKIISHYDENGNLVKSQFYDCEGWIDLPSKRETYTYDEQGRETSVTYSEFLKREKTVWTTSYDDEANSVTSTHNDESITTRWLDENGEPIRERIEDLAKGNSIEVTYTREATEEGLFVTSVHTYVGYSNLGYTTERIESHYTTDGKMISSHHYQDDTLVVTFEYEYDDQGRCTRYTHWGIESGERESRYLYEEGRKTWFKPDGGTQIAYFDEHGNRVCLEDRDENGRLTMMQTYTYTQIPVIPREEE